jgi:hypothetical protein
MPFRNIPQSSSTPIFENPLNANGWGEEKVGRCWTVAFKTQDNQPNEVRKRERALGQVKEQEGKRKEKGHIWFVPMKR